MFSNYVKTMNQGLIDTLSLDCLKRNDETAKFKVKYMEHQQASAWVNNLPGNSNLSLKRDQNSPFSQITLGHSIMDHIFRKIT